MKLIKNYRKILIIFIAFLIPFTSCSSGRKTIKEPIYGKYVDEIVNSYLSYIKKQYGLECFGMGGGFRYNVNKISLYLQTNPQKIDIEKARVLLVNCIEDLLKRINQDEKIRPYLEHYPFTAKGISISIIFCDYFSKQLPKDLLAKIFSIEGNIYYYNYNQEKKESKWFYKESYSDALKKVKESEQLPLSESTLSIK